MDTYPLAPSTNIHTVMNIEDSPASAELVKQVIDRRSDLKLITAITGKSGIELANSMQPDVILLDSHLPDIGGLAVLKILLSSDQTAHIPVIAVSSDAFPKQIEAGLQAGYFAYLTKPYKIAALMDAIDSALQLLPQTH
jgi:CheY-like chemotaxis protein